MPHYTTRRLVLGLTIVGALVVAALIAFSLQTVHDGPVLSSPHPTTAIPTPVPPFFSSWPNAANTGVPTTAGSLQKMGRLTVTVDGSRYTHLEIDDCVDVKANNVTITESIVRCGRPSAAVQVFSGRHGLLLDQVEIDGSSHTAACIAFSGFTIYRSNLHDCIDGIDLSSNVVIEGCFIHDLARGDGTHNDALQLRGGNHDLIKDNTLQAYRASTGDFMNAAIQTGSLNKNLSDVVVDHNYMDGGNYTVNAGGTGGDGYLISGYVFKNNVFGRHFRYGTVQSVGPETTFDESNVWLDNKQPVRAKG
jgi:hypothetical protein